VGRLADRLIPAWPEHARKRSKKLHKPGLCAGLRLFLPEDRRADAGRRAAAGVPEAITYRPKWGIALDEIDRVLASGAVHRAAVHRLRAAGGCRVRQGGRVPRRPRGAAARLRGRGAADAEGLSRGRGALFPCARGGRPAGRPRKHPVPPAASAGAAELLEARPGAFRTIPWRAGTKGPLRAAFAALRVRRVADGPAAARGQHLPGEEAWLVGEHRASGERKHYLSDLPPGARLERLATPIKARWVREQVHQQMRGELGLGHFEGRSWRGLHHHALLGQLAFAFLQHLRPRGKKRRSAGASRAAAPAEPARGAAAHPGRAQPCPVALPALPAALRPSPPPMNVAG
jgi:hypothetical protein